MPIETLDVDDRKSPLKTLKMKFNPGQCTSRGRTYAPLLSWRETGHETREMSWMAWM